MDATANAGTAGPRPRPGSRLAAAIIGLASGFALVACAATDGGASPTTPAAPTSAAASPSPTPSPTPVPTFAPETVDDLGALCLADEVTYHDAADYRGSGPHQIAIFEFEAGDDTHERRLVPLEDHNG